MGKHKKDMSDVCKKHKPKQHRDGKSPWCDKCGLDADYKKPMSRFTQ